MTVAVIKDGASTGAPSDMEARVRIDALADLTFPELRGAWRMAWGTPPPKGARRRFLMLGIAWRWQADLHGGFKPQTARRLAALEAAARNGADLQVADIAKPALPGPGSRLIRVWQGTRHEVHVTETAYLWRGSSFASLSAIARAITGGSRNGPAFFGLRKGVEPAQ